MCKIAMGVALIAADDVPISKVAAGCLTISPALLLLSSFPLYSFPGRIEGLYVHSEQRGPK